MPTLLKRNGKKWWQARWFALGRQGGTKLYPWGPKGGPSWREAKAWEEEQKAAHLAGKKASSGCAIFARWLQRYLEHAWRTMTQKTAKEKAAVLDDFADYCLDRNPPVKTPEQITTQVVDEFLNYVHDQCAHPRRNHCDRNCNQCGLPRKQRGPFVANKYRKNLQAAWNWGTVKLDDFPEKLSPFFKVKPFKVQHSNRYVPPDADVLAVLNQVSGQDAVLLLAYIQTGARRGELFRLKWDDVDLERRQIRLNDKKAGGGGGRERWQGIGDDLAQALTWWKEARPVDVPNVFLQLSYHQTRNTTTGEITTINPGDPFLQRRHLMKTLCERAGVKPFGFHALRHKAAELVYLAGNRNTDVQALLGHAKATTTDQYLQSAGLRADKSQVVNAILCSSVGKAAAEQAKKTLTPEAATSEANL